MKEVLLETLMISVVVLSLVAMILGGLYAADRQAVISQERIPMKEGMLERLRAVDNCLYPPFLPVSKLLDDDLYSLDKYPPGGHESPAAGCGQPLKVHRVNAVEHETSPVSVATY